MKTFIVNVKSPVGTWSVVGTDEGVTPHSPASGQTDRLERGSAQAGG